MLHNFSPEKMLVHVDRWRSLAEGVVPLPVTASVDFSTAALCPNKCYFCNVKRTQKDPVNMERSTFETMLRVFKKMRLVSCCISGGGESLVHPDAEEFMVRIVQEGIELGIITNGCVYRAVPGQCKFINISVNGTNPEMYKKMTGSDSLRVVLWNAAHWVDAGQDVTLKFMITDRNKGLRTMVEAAECALSAGVKSVLFRYAYRAWDEVGKKEFIHLKKEEGEATRLQLDALCKWYPTIRFRMPLDRYDDQAKRLVPSECFGGYISPVIMADGNVALCPDHRTNPKMHLCRIEDLRQFWGSQKHKDLISRIDPSKCPRCSYYQHIQLIKNFVMDDETNQNFL